MSRSCVPYLGVSVLDLQHDLFYLAYFAVTIALIGSFAVIEQVDVVEVFRPRWRWSLGVGVVVAAFLIFNVLRNEDATERPNGVYFLFELLWRGARYGIVDTLLLTVFPCFVAYQLLHGRVEGLKGKLRFTALALPLVIVVTATCHFGYPQYRDDGLSRPETGNILISIPTFATASRSARSSRMSRSTSRPSRIRTSRTSSTRRRRRHDRRGASD